LGKGILITNNVWFAEGAFQSRLRFRFPEIHSRFGNSHQYATNVERIWRFELSESIIVVDCLQGNCSVEGEGQGAMSLQAGRRVTLISGDLGGVEPLVEHAVSSWNELCGSCLSVP
jgi:hypothetical protein